MLQTALEADAINSEALAKLLKPENLPRVMEGDAKNLVDSLKIADVTNLLHSIVARVDLTTDSRLKEIGALCLDKLKTYSGRDRLGASELS